MGVDMTQLSINGSASGTGLARRVAAPDSLKSETFYLDLRILINHAAERNTATAATIVDGPVVSYAEDRPQLSPKALERRKCGTSLSTC